MDPIDPAPTKIRLCDPPHVCSSCGGQYVERLHVDFGAAWDGPMIPSEHIAGHQPISVDDLIVCEECVRAAAELVGMAPRDDDTIERLTTDLDVLGDRLAGAVQYIATLEQTLAGKDNLAELMGVKAKTPEATTAKPRAKR